MKEGGRARKTRGQNKKGDDAFWFVGEKETQLGEIEKIYQDPVASTTRNQNSVSCIQRTRTTKIPKDIRIIKTQYKEKAQQYRKKCHSHISHTRSGKK